MVHVHVWAGSMITSLINFGQGMSSTTHLVPRAPAPRRGDSDTIVYPGRHAAHGHEGHHEAHAPHGAHSVSIVRVRSVDNFGTSLTPRALVQAKCRCKRPKLKAGVNKP